MAPGERARFRSLIVPSGTEPVTAACPKLSPSAFRLSTFFAPINPEPLQITALRERRALAKRISPRYKSTQKMPRSRSSSRFLSAWLQSSPINSPPSEKPPPSALLPSSFGRSAFRLPLCGTCQFLNASRTQDKGNAAPKVEMIVRANPESVRP